MQRPVIALVSLSLAWGCSPSSAPRPPSSFEITTEVLRDKIRGGWAGQTIGVTYGGPTEFRYNGTMIQDYVPIVWYDGYLLETFTNRPGLYDDIYIDLTFVEVLEEKGLDATAMDFAEEFASRDYPLWFANQMARYNIRNGLTPPESGHWLNNPEADAIDFQIEADFAGLMNPGLPNAATEVSDRVGHLMNHGDGFYGGVYVAALYSLAFVSEDIGEVVRGALETIPTESTFRQTLTDVIRWHGQYPEDWKRTWFEIEKKWSEDVGSPRGVFQAFNIDAKLNSAYVVMALLYGDGDFAETLDIAVRAGQDSDCNPSTAAGVLGVMLGYEAIPDYWKQGLSEIEGLEFPYTSTSLEEVYELSFRHALGQIEAHGGSVEGDVVRIEIETPEAVPLEQNFEAHHPAEELPLRREVRDETAFTFEGIGFAVTGEVRTTSGKEHTFSAELYIDGELDEQFPLPSRFTERRFTPFWKYQLAPGPHEIRIVLTNPSPDAHLWLDYAIVYR